MSHSLCFILEGKTPKEVDTETWAKWNQESEHIRHMFKTYVRDIYISTVFLGLNHGMSEKHPILFETMVFGGELNEECVRYMTYDDAEEGHNEMVERVKNAK